MQYEDDDKINYAELYRVGLPSEVSPKRAFWQWVFSNIYIPLWVLLTVAGFILSAVGILDFLKVLLPTVIMCAFNIGLWAFIKVDKDGPK
jgi:hypothetical protein